MTRMYSGFTGVVVASVLSLAAIPVYAQDDGARRQIAFEEIVVTSRKKEESLQEVPLAITAFSAAEIESARIEDLNDIAALTPGLTFSNLIGDFLPVPVIRGMAPTAIFQENNAAIFLDGVFVSGREGLNFNFLDLERIEVVKGPQSAMYGRNAFSGAINYISKRPGDKFEAKVDATGGSDGRAGGNAAISGPIFTDALRGRVAIGYDTFDGTYDNHLSNEDIGGYENTTVQGSLWWTPTESLDIGLTAYWSDDRISESPMSNAAANCEDQSQLPAGSLDRTQAQRNQNWCGEVPGAGEDDIQIIEHAKGEDRDLLRASIDINWDVGFGTFEFLTGYSDTEQTSLNNGARSFATVPFVYTNTGFPLGDASFDATQLQVGTGNETREISQEIRFSSPDDEAFRYSIGGYWFDVEKKTRDLGIIARTLPADSLGICPCFMAGPATLGDLIYGPWFGPGGDVNSDVDAREDSDSWAVFGSVELDFLEDFTGRAELRYTDEEKDLARPQASAGAGLSRSDSWDYFTGRLSLDYRVSDVSMVYAYIARGEKSGGFDSDDVEVLVPGMPNLDKDLILPFDTEANTTYELGYKGGSRDGLVRVDLALYFIDWEDVVVPQIIQNDPETGFPLDQPVAFDTNAGDADIWGYELNLDMNFTDNWSGRVGVSWTDATWDDNALSSSFRTWPSFYNDADGDGRGDLVPIGGKHLLRQSEWQGNATVNYLRAVTRDMDWFTRADVFYQSSQFVGNDNQGKIPSRTTVNLSLGLQADRWSVTLWSNNLFDEDGPVTAFRDVFFNNTHDGVTSSVSGDLFPWRLSVRNAKLRTYGLTARYRFGGD